MKISTMYDVLAQSVACGVLFIGCTTFMYKSYRLLSYFAAKGLTRVIIAYAGARSNYRWTFRAKSPRLLQSVGDFLFKLDENATVDCPKNLVESIKVISANLKTENCSLEVSNELQSFLPEMDDEEGFIRLKISRLLYPAKSSGEWSLDVVYRGHADPSKRISSGEYGVKYIAKEDCTIVFPPYSAKEKKKSGFKSSKVIYARTFHEKDLTILARKYAGLRANFYQDVSCPHVIKNYIDHKEVHVLLSAGGTASTTVVVGNVGK